MHRRLVLVLAFAAPAAAQPSLRAPVVYPFAVPAAVYVQTPDPNCKSFPHVYEKDRVLYKNGAPVARDTKSWAASCSGALVWQDSWGYLYKDGLKLGTEGAESYKITRYSGHVLWQTGWGKLWRDADKLSDDRPDAIKHSDWTGDVAWKGSHDKLFKNTAQLSGYGDRVGDFTIAQYSGDVVWEGGFGDLFKNETKLGKPSRYDVAPTGDVAWTDSYRGLYKNDRRVADGIDQWFLREDGRLIWYDSRGNQYSE